MKISQHYDVRMMRKREIIGVEVIAPNRPSIERNESNILRAVYGEQLFDAAILTIRKINFSVLVL